MRDAAGRTIEYMRISVTDRCNLRCRYCMPEGIAHVPMKELLTLEEIVEVAEIAAGEGIRFLKLTGGEPLVRPGFSDLIAMLKAVPGIEQVTMTTNGVLLREKLKELLAAGVDGINISLDTLEEGAYEALTGFPGLPGVLEVIRQSESVSVPIKINAVSLDIREFARTRGIETAKEGWRGLVELARDYPVDVRFIELMPIGLGRGFGQVSHARLLEAIKEAYPGLERDLSFHGNGPAVYYRIPGFRASIGLISAIHGKFCEGCNRIRLTSTGYLKACLCYEDGVDLRRILRSKEKGRRERLREAFWEAAYRKPRAHCFDRPEKVTESAMMAQIGG